ncbi:AI-2E family transporter [Streptomyces sp. NPDC057438]|uniref:AI-2E family transporter n=1 Tax=Streptomyces sp. NPDC057438 TaxID=3346133 RepID=UPI0036C194A1
MAPRPRPARPHRPPSARRPSAERSAPPWGRTALRVWTAIGAFALAWLLLRVLRPLAPLLWPLAVAGVISYFLAPLVASLERRRIRRGLAAVLVTAGLAAAVFGLGFLLVPPLIDQISEATAGLPASAEDAERQLNVLARRLGLDVRARLDGAAIASWLEQEESRDALARVLSGLGTITRIVALGLLLTLAGLVIGFYLLADLPRVARCTAALLPERRRAEVGDVARQCLAAAGAYLRGQLLVSLFVGTASALALWAIGLRYWLFVGVVAGVTNLVPFVGPLVGGVLAVAIALLTGSLLQAVGAAAVILVVQQVESHVVSPLVLGRVVRLPPVVVVVVVLIGAAYAGVIGMLVAVPVTACARIVMRHLHR